MHSLHRLFVLRITDFIPFQVIVVSSLPSFPSLWPNLLFFIQFYGVFSLFFDRHVMFGDFKRKKGRILGRMWFFVVPNNWNFFFVMSVGINASFHWTFVLGVFRIPVLVYLIEKLRVSSRILDQCQAEALDLELLSWHDYLKLEWLVVLVSVFMETWMSQSWFGLARVLVFSICWILVVLLLGDSFCRYNCSCSHLISSAM